jgi:GTP-binding protein
MKGIPVVAIIGKPNAGKSTLFNRIVRRRKAITHSTRGVTRDAVEERVEWSGVPFTLLDTGGIMSGTKDALAASVRARVRSIAREAAVIVLVVDVDTGLTSEDELLVRDLQRERPKMVLAINKVESDSDRWSVHEFHRLGIAAMFPLSALHGSGIGELLDEEIGRASCRERVSPSV